MRISFIQSAVLLAACGAFGASNAAFAQESALVETAPVAAIIPQGVMLSDDAADIPDSSTAPLTSVASMNFTIDVNSDQTEAPISAPLAPAAALAAPLTLDLKPSAALDAPRLSIDPAPDQETKAALDQGAVTEDGALVLDVIAVPAPAAIAPPKPAPVETTLSAAPARARLSNSRAPAPVQDKSLAGLGCFPASAC